jgi:hypothetical protein
MERCVWGWNNGQPTLILPSQGDPVVNVAFSGPEASVCSHDGIFRFYILNIEELVAWRCASTRSFTIQSASSTCIASSARSGSGSTAKVINPPATPTLAVADPRQRPEAGYAN